MPDLEPYDDGWGEIFDVAALDCDDLRGGYWLGAQRLYQMRADLGRLDAVAKILQVRSLLAALGCPHAAMI
jgi:hypothetical protein